MDTSMLWIAGEDLRAGDIVGRNEDGHLVKAPPPAQYYTSEMAGSGQFGTCAKCKKEPAVDGHDGCLGTLPGLIMNACCGHGNDSQAYIQYQSGRRIAGDEAIAEQAKLLKQMACKEY